MIEIKGLTKSFGNKIVLNDLNLTIPSHTIFGLVGINGAGKSTLLRILSNAYDKTSGEVLIDGKPVSDVESKKNIFFLPDEPYSAHSETVNSLLDFYKIMYDFETETFIKYVKLFKLDEAIEANYLNANISKFSKGMKRQLLICIALAIAPKYLFLDEAFDGLDPLARLTFKKIILERMEETEMTVIISSHSLRELEDLCDLYGLLDGGVIDNTGGIEQSKESYQKYQLAFEDEKSKEYFENLNIVSYNRLGRIVKIIVKGDTEENYQKIVALKPLVLDKLPIDFEELFIIEVESKGYLKNE